MFNITRRNPGPSEERSFAKFAALAGATLILPLAAHADVILTIPSSGPITEISTDSGPDQSYSLDMTNGLSTPQFTFNASYSDLDVTVTPLGTAGQNAFDATLPVPLGTEIGSSSTFLDSTNTGVLQSSTYVDDFKQQNGPWPQDGSFAYLGVQFYYNGDPFYGWIYLSASTPQFPVTDVSTFTIADWAYNNVSGDPITAGEGQTLPEPSSLAMFALGAAGLLALRARRKRPA